MNIAIVGLGLIGGSIGLAARARGDQVAAFDNDPDGGSRRPGGGCGDLDGRLAGRGRLDR